MNYSDTIQWLFGLQKYGIKLGLDTITRLLECLDNPHSGIPCIHIGGTNGKGSTAAFLCEILQNAGYRAGLFTSPHLIDFTERIRINAECIGEADVVRLTEQLRAVCERCGLKTVTFFEFVTAMAIQFFLSLIHI